MTRPTAKRTRVTWGNDEVHQLLDFLISNKAKLSQAGGYPTSVFTAASLHLGPDKNSATTSSKWSTLKRTYNAIEAYRQRSGVHWDNDNGANIVTESEAAAWDAFLSSSPIGRELAPFRNKGWPFYDKMSEIYPEGASRGNVSFQPVEANAGLGGNTEFGEDADAIDGFGLPPPGNNIIGPSSQPDSSGQLFVSTFDSTPAYQLGPAGNQEFSGHEGMGVDFGLDFDFDLDQLLGIVPAVTSPKALTQEAAVRSIIGTLNQATSGLSAPPSAMSMPPATYHSAQPPMVHHATPHTTTSSLHSASIPGWRGNSSSGSGKRTFSEMAGPSHVPSQTNLLTSAKLASRPASRPTSRPTSRPISHPASCRTPASTAKTPSIGSSQPVSKRSRTGTIEPESTHVHAAAMTGMTGAIHHISDLLKQALSSTSSSPPSTSITAVPSQDYTILAAQFIDEDKLLPAAVRTFLVVEMVNNEPLCKMYASMSDPAIRHAVAMQYYQKKFPQANVAMQAQDNAAAGGSSNFYNVYFE